MITAKLWWFLAQSRHHSTSRKPHAKDGGRLRPCRGAEAAKAAQQTTRLLQEPPLVMASEISTSIKGDPLKFEITSRRIGPYVQYTFDFMQGKANFAMNIPRLYKYFADGGVQPDCCASKVLKFGRLPLRDAITDFDAYSIFKPSFTKVDVKIPPTSAQIRRQVLLLIDQDNQVVSSGFVTLHVPGPAE